MRCDSPARRIIAGLSAVLVLAGCTHVHPADPTAAGTDLDHVNAKLADRVVRVRLLDGTELLAHDVSLSADSVSMRPQMIPEADWWLGPRRALPASEVGSLEVTRRGRGALDGALLGLGIGCASGAAIGVSLFPRGPILFTTAGQVATLGGVLFGVLGTGLGLLVGGSVGSTDVYDLTRATGARSSESPGE
jgi:hypothetical protein